MKTSIQYAEEAFKAAEEGKEYSFAPYGLTFLKSEEGYELRSHTELGFSLFSVNSKEELAEILRYNMPCAEDQTSRVYLWDDNVPEEDFEAIIRKIENNIKEDDGSNYNYIDELYTDQVRVRDKIYAFELNCKISETGYTWYGSYISVRRVR